MCVDLDLFGQVIVKQSDVLFWLHEVANMQGKTQQRKELYAEQYEISNKIIKSKLSGEFYKLIEQAKTRADYEAQPLELFKTKYARPWARKPCPPYFHVCAFMDCPIFLKRRKSAQNRLQYLARKKRAQNAPEVGTPPK